MRWRWTVPTVGYAFVPHERVETIPTVLGDASSFSGYVMGVLPIGMMEILDQRVREEKIPCVGQNNRRYREGWN